MSAINTTVYGFNYGSIKINERVLARLKCSYYPQWAKEAVETVIAAADTAVHHYRAAPAVAALINRVALSKESSVDLRALEREHFEHVIKKFTVVTNSGVYACAGTAVMKLLTNALMDKDLARVFFEEAMAEARVAGYAPIVTIDNEWASIDVIKLGQRISTSGSKIETIAQCCAHRAPYQSEGFVVCLPQASKADTASSGFIYNADVYGAWSEQLTAAQRQVLSETLTAR